MDDLLTVEDQAHKDHVSSSLLSQLSWLQLAIQPDIEED